MLVQRSGLGQTFYVDTSCQSLTRVLGELICKTEVLKATKKGTKSSQALQRVSVIIPALRPPISSSERWAAEAAPPAARGSSPVALCGVSLGMNGQGLFPGDKTTGKARLANQQTPHFQADEAVNLWPQELDSLGTIRV